MLVKAVLHNHKKYMFSLTVSSQSHDSCFHPTIIFLLMGLDVLNPLSNT